MKLLIISIFMLTFSMGYAQNSEEYAIKELAELHLRTNFVRDSIKKLIKASDLKIKDETDEVKKKNYF